MRETGITRQRTKMKHGRIKEEMMEDSTELYIVTIQNIETTGLIPNDKEDQEFWGMYCVELTVKLLKSVSTPKSPGSASEHVSSQTKSKGKLTRKVLRLHNLDGLPDGTELAYYVCGQKMLEGYKKSLGIFCLHCENKSGPSKFEVRAGYASRHKPYLNIYTTNRVSLHKFYTSLSRGWKLSNKDNDDPCSYCTGFGDLLCCDMRLRAFPKGWWIIHFERPWSKPAL